MQPTKLFELLLKYYGEQGWWPSKTSFEMMVGAILTQNTSWKNVEKSINEMRKQGLLKPITLAEASTKTIAAAIKSSGYYNQKAERLKLLAEHTQKYSSLQKIFSKPLPELRKELLSLKGIGPETADSIILYAAKKPIFVIDAYTKRLAERLPLTKEFQDYNALQDFFHKNTPKSTQAYNEYHALIVKHCKEYCKKKPLCSECFLRKDCSRQGLL